MAAPQGYERDKNGARFLPGGIDTVTSLDSLAPNKYAYVQNCRALKNLQIVGRATESAPVISGLPTPVHSLRLLSDSTPNGPVAGYVRVVGAAGTMWVNSTEIATGLSGNPISILPFRPNQSVQPWAYCGDPSENVIISTKKILTGGAVNYPTTGAVKVRSDGLIFHSGIAEPQITPIVSTQNYTTTGTDILPATTIPWTNVGGVNTNYNYGQTNASDGTAPIVITGGGPFLVAGSSVTLTVTGSATVNGATHAPGDAGPTSASYPGAFIAGAKIVVGAFTDASGNVVPPGGSLPLVFPIGAGTTVTVPANASQLQVGIDSSANTFSANSGSYSVAWSATVSAIATVISTVGNVTAYVWGTPPPAGGGSPHSGPVASYIWKNPNDGGSGTPRSITDPVPDASPTNNSWVFDSTPEDGTVPVNWNVLNPDGSVLSTIPLFDPALESEGYQDFNVCIVGSLFVPAAGTYSFSIKYKDQIMFGVGGGATVAYASGATGSTTGPLGQKITVVDSLPIGFVSTANGSGGNQTTGLNITFPGSGVYQVEADWDYWSHTGRSFILTCTQSTPNSPTIPPLPFGVRTGVQYRYVYRSSATGALSNPSPESVLQQTPVLANEVTSIFSTDPQVDKVDYYRIDAGLLNFTYVATGPNDGLGGTSGAITYNTPIEDELSDTAVAANQILQFDNYEPFPVIDLPRKGVVNVTGGVITWVSGDLFNIRWLPGTAILIGFPTSLAYTFVARPYPAGFQTGTVYVQGEIILDPAFHFQQVTVPGNSGGSAPTFNDTGGTTTSGGVTFQDKGLIFNGNGYVTEIAIPNVPDGTNLVYEIPEPDLAAQPLPYIFGPTDNENYYFGVGDQLNPGTLYFTKGNNPDSAPQTNQIGVTSPSEILVNGVKTAAEAMVWSTERRWLIYPTFTTALATVSGVAGSPFNVVEATGSRGLYIPTCLTTDGGKTAFFRAKDGLFVCEFGGADVCITDDIFNLFPREGVIPQPITIAGNTIYPPNDAIPNAQKLAWSPTALFYDYEDVNGIPRTLVYDFMAKGWSVDVGQFLFQSHAWEEGNNTDTVMVGCSDGSVRVLGSGNAETCTSIVIPGAQNAGDARAFKRVGDVFIKALVQASNPITVALYANRYIQTLAGFSPTSLTGTGSLLPYIVDFTSGFGNDVIDVGLSLSWPTAAANVLDLWQPDWINLPESIQDRPTDWDFMGGPANKLVRGFLLELDTFNASKIVQVERSEDDSIFTPSESPATINGQTLKAFTFNPPFVSHSVRIVSTDGVPWRRDWGTPTWIVDPWAEYATLRSEWSNLGVQGAKYIRGLVLPMDTQGLAATIHVVTSDGATVSFTATTASAVKTPVAFAFVPPIVAHDVQIQMLTATAGVWFDEARWDQDLYPEIIPEYTPIMEVSGPDNKFVQGIKLIADSSNIPVTFQVLYDGGQAGPTFTGSWNGKQTLIFSWTPFLAHDIQLVPQGNARIWWGGIGDGVSEWVHEPFPESTQLWQTELTSLGGVGWQHLRLLNIEYVSSASATLSFVVDTGNRSIAPASITIPSSGGTQTKLKLTPTFNKWKIISFQILSSAPITIFQEGFECWTKSWGSSSSYEKQKPFGGPSSSGAIV